MRLATGIRAQCSDLVCYVLLPGFSVLVPGAFSRWLLWRISCWEWIMHDAAAASLEGAAKHVEIKNATDWRRRWKRVEMLDVRDLYLMIFGRSGTVIGEIECCAPIEVAQNRVMVGMHWGPGISILKLLAVRGLNPAFPYRPPQRQLLRSRPFHYLFSKLTARYLKQTLGERAVPVGGAGKVLQGLLEREGSICILMDAPPMQGRRAASEKVLGRDAWFNTGFPALMADRHKEYVFYAMNLRADGSLKKSLELEGPFKAHDAKAFLRAYADFLHRHAARDSAQWRFWRVEEQFWKTDGHQ